MSYFSETSFSLHLLHVGVSTRCDGEAKPVKPSLFKRLWLQLHVEAFVNTCALSSVPEWTCASTPALQQSLLLAQTSSPAGFNVIFLLYFENGAATLVQRSSFYTCTESLGSSCVNTRPAGELLVRMISMCEYGSSTASPVVSPARVKGVSELDISVSMFVVNLLMLNPDSSPL